MLRLLLFLFYHHFFRLHIADASLNKICYYLIHQQLEFTKKFIFLCEITFDTKIYSYEKSFLYQSIHKTFILVFSDFVNVVKRLIFHDSMTTNNNISNNFLYRSCVIFIKSKKRSLSLLDTLSFLILFIARQKHLNME